MRRTSDESVGKHLEVDTETLLVSSDTRKVPKGAEFLEGLPKDGLGIVDD